MPRWKRVLFKLSLRLRLAARMLSSFEDSFGRGRMRISFAQDGEDLIAWRLLHELGIPLPRYLDIGANDPEHLSNTALFHLLGATGVNIEPEPALHAQLVRCRPRDLNLNLGIGPANGVLTFHRMDNPSLSTFSAAEAERLIRDEGVTLRDRISIPVRRIREVLEEQKFQPDFMSIDVEGSELAILESYDWDQHRPGVICVETVGYSRRGDKPRETGTRALLESQGYVQAAQTLCNSLFIDWKYRRP